MSTTIFDPSKKIGMLGGGQLGKMLLQSAMDLGVEMHVMDPDENCPCSIYSRNFFKGDYSKKEDALEFGSSVDILTIEIEKVNVDALEELERRGVKIFPQPAILRKIQDKGSQKEMLHALGFPTASFMLAEASDDDKITAAFQFPFVLKYRRDGYDGRGVMMIRNEDDLLFHLNRPVVIEKKVNIAKEVAVIVSRNETGVVSVYDPVEINVDQDAHLLDLLSCPATMSLKTNEEVKRIASELIAALQMTGLLAVEFFIDQDEQILINEISPRPHNSGHHTIEACVTSQYEQLVRTLLGLPPGSTKLRSPVVMMNLLGADGHYGQTRYTGMETWLSDEHVHFHLYGKKITRPKRKMGHVTIVHETLNEAYTLARKIKQQVKIIS